MSRRSESGQLTSPHGALQRAGKYFRKGQSAQPFPQPLGIAFPALRERQISEAGVLTGNRPRRFAVPRQVDGGESLAHVLLLVVKRNFNNCFRLIPGCRDELISFALLRDFHFIGVTW
jgi:hypothetical protein